MCICSSLESISSLLTKLASLQIGALEHKEIGKKRRVRCGAE